MLRNSLVISTLILALAIQQPAGSLAGAKALEAPQAASAQVAPPSFETVLADLQSSLAKVKRLRASASGSAPVDPARLKELHAAASAINSELQSWGASLAKTPEVGDRQPTQRARTQAKTWIDEIRALGADAPSRREAALTQVRAALAGKDADAQLAALTTLQSVGDVEYDKAPFRNLILPFAQTARGPTLVAALYALKNTQAEPTDLALVHAAWGRDPKALDDTLLHFLTMFGAGSIEGRSEEIALEWMAQYEVHGGNSGINGVWGARVGPRLEAKFLELERSENRELRHCAIYFGLSTFADKSPAVIDALIRTLADADPNNSDRALWGLGQGVPAASHSKVVDALVELHNGRSNPQVRASCRSLVGRYGGAQALERLAR